MGTLAVGISHTTTCDGWARPGGRRQTGDEMRHEVRRTTAHLESDLPASHGLGPLTRGMSGEHWGLLTCVPRARQLPHRPVWTSLPPAPDLNPAAALTAGKEETRNGPDSESPTLRWGAGEACSSLWSRTTSLCCVTHFTSMPGWGADLCQALPVCHAIILCRPGSFSNPTVCGNSYGPHFRD